MAQEKVNKEPAKDLIVRPAVNPAQALTAWDAYEALKKQIIKPEDAISIKGKIYLKKSYWRKIATFFNLTVTQVEGSESTERIIKDDSKTPIICKVTYRAVAPNGRAADGDGASELAPQPDSIHKARSMAHTRAFNRAVSNLVGGGEVTAEEISGEVKAAKKVADAPYAHQDDTPEWVESVDDIPQGQDQPPASQGTSAYVNAKQISRLFAIMNEHKWSRTAMVTHINTRYGVDKPDLLTQETYDETIKYIEKGEF